jgi:hypothetical protein
MPSRADRRTTATLLGQRVAAAHAVDLARIGRTHHAEQEGIAFGDIGGQVVFRK